MTIFIAYKSGLYLLLTFPEKVLLESAPTAEAQSTINNKYNNLIQENNDSEQAELVHHIFSLCHFEKQKDNYVEITENIKKMCYSVV